MWNITFNAKSYVFLPGKKYFQRARQSSQRVNVSTWANSAIEKTHLQFCKRYLQVHNKASNIACRAELGKFPMIIDINKKILNYIDYLIGKDEDSIVKQALQFLIDLHHNGKTSFYSNLMKMVDYYDLNYDFSCNSLSDSIVNR